MLTPGERLKAAREANGFETAKDAALAMAVPIATYTQHEKAAKHLPARRADEYAKFFGLTPEYLLFGRGDVPDRIPVMDGRGANTGKTAALPGPPSGLTRALECDGFAHYGLVAIYDHPQSARPSADVYGRLCVVGIDTEAGTETQRLVGLVQRGTTANRVHLIGGAMPKIDILPAWIAPVTALIPA
jgi:hypothetical protein